MKKVAIFDIDGTIFRSSLLIELVEVLVELGYFDASIKKEYEAEQKAWVGRKGSYEAYITAVIAAFMKHLKGVLYADFDRSVSLVIERHRNKMYRYTRDLIIDLKKKGYFLLAISQSPKSILDQFCRDLGFDKVYGRIYEIGATDRFTGVVTDEHLIMNKANIVRRAVEKEQLTLEDSIGVGDTEGDISVLELVTHPICFNPNAMLYKHAKRNNWKVVVERKDVIYVIQ